MPILGSSSSGGSRPTTPVIGAVTTGDGSVSVAFTPSSYVGKGTITYTATSSPSGITATGSSSPVTVTGLSNGTAYTFTVFGTTNYGVTSETSSVSSSATPAVPVRGVFSSTSYGAVQPMQYVNINSEGNALYFGDMTVARDNAAGCASSTRGIFAGGGGYPNGNSNVIDYITIFTTGNTTDFGDLTVARFRVAGLSSSTRGIFAGGDAVTNTIDYITIASTGNATDFGDATGAFRYGAGLASTTRGVYNWGVNSVGAGQVAFNIDYVTIATTGNGTNFGNLSVKRYSNGACSNSTRGLFMAGVDFSVGNYNIIDYVTIASTGNATDFGDLLGVQAQGAAVASSTIALHNGGNSTGNDIINKVTIATTGNATSFGNSGGFNQIGGLSSGHGGL